MGAQHADTEPPVARSQGSYQRQQGRRLSRRKALSRAHVAGAGLRACRPMVQGRQLYAFRSIYRHARGLRRIKEEVLPEVAHCSVTRRFGSLGAPQKHSGEIARGDLQERQRRLLAEAKAPRKQGALALRTVSVTILALPARDQA